MNNEYESHCFLTLSRFILIFPCSTDIQKQKIITYLTVLCWQSMHPSIPDNWNIVQRGRRIYAESIDIDAISNVRIIRNSKWGLEICIWWDMKLESETWMSFEDILALILKSSRFYLNASWNYWKDMSFLFLWSRYCCFKIKYIICIHFRTVFIGNWRFSYGIYVRQIIHGKCRHATLHTLTLCWNLQWH